MWNTQTFAQSVRQKYPDAVTSAGVPYSEVSDQEITEAMVRKYPVYANQIEGYGAPVKPKKDLLQTASDVGGFLFPGTKQIGESLGTIAAAGGEALRGNFDEAGEILETQKSVPELIGAYTAAGASALGTAGVGASGGLLAKALQSAGLGAAIGGGDVAAEGGNAEDVAKSAATGAVIGAGTSAAFSGAEAALKGLQGLPERLIRSATGQSTKELLAGKDVSKYVLDNKKIGTAQQLLKQSEDAIEQADLFINESLASDTTKAIPIKGIIEDISSAINNAGGEIDEVGVRSVLENLAPQVKKTIGKETLSLAEANQLRSQLDKILGDRAFISSQLPFNKTLLKDFSNAIREQVKGNAPQGVRQAFATLSSEIRLRDLLAKKMAGASRGATMTLGDLVAGGAGGAVGGVPGIVAGALGRRAAESTLFKTGAANVVRSLDKTLTPVLEGLEPAARTAIISAIVQGLTAPQEGQSSPQVETRE